MARPRQAQRAHSRGQRILGIVFKFFTALTVLVIVGVLVLFGSALIVYHSYASQFQAPDQFALNQPSIGAKILDRNGQLLYQYVSDYEGLREPVKLQDVSPALVAATIATEDSSFFNNPGVNTKGLARAAWENFSPLAATSGLLQSGGGSSITQQLVKNVYITPDERSKRSLDRKLREVVFAVELTKRYPKEQILEWYLNQINYGGVYNGIEAASQGYFGKSAKDLTLGEAALLAGIPQSPSKYDPMVDMQGALDRRNQILDLLEKHQPIRIGDNAYFSATPDEIAAARVEPVNLKVQDYPVQAPHFVLNYLQPRLEAIFGRDALMKDGLTITTSLDLDLQNQAQDILNHYVKQNEAATGTHNGAMVIMAPQTGEILAMVGSLDYWRADIDGQLNAADAAFTPGSSFKPFVYLTSFIKLGWTPASIVQDIPTSYRESDGTVFTPQDPVAGSYQGNITVRNALGNSLNIPAFRTAGTLGVSNIVPMAKSFGFTGLNGQYGPSIAIGGVDLKLIDLVFGYSVLANAGVMRGTDSIAPHSPDERQIDPVSILKAVDARGNVRYDIEQHRTAKNIVGPEYTYMITNILTDPRATCITFGCGGLQVPGYTVAVKTGTGQPYVQTGAYKGLIGDTLAFGYTPDLAVGVWAGNDDNTPVHNIFSTTIAFPAMRDAMLTAYNGRPETPFQRPETVTTRNGDLAPLAPIPAAAAPQRTGPEPPQCAQLRGKPYASDQDRQYFLQNCVGIVPNAGAPGGSPAPAPGATGLAPAPVNIGPDRTSCTQIQGTPYRSDSERAWYLANCRG